MENHRKQDAAGFWERKHKEEEALQRRTNYLGRPAALWDSAGLKRAGLRLKPSWRPPPSLLWAQKPTSWAL